jgi:nucleoside-diphosphate-sugar epimerase
MRYLVTGGSGFIGTNLVDALLKNGNEVLNLDIKPPKNENHITCWKKINLLDLPELTRSIALFNPKIIFHLAARTDLNGKSIDEYQENTLGVNNLISSVKDLTHLKLIIFASSRLVCEIGYTPKDDNDFRPTTPYGESKTFGEKLIRASESSIPWAWTIVRPTSIWGPWFDTPYKTFFTAIQNGHYFHPGNVKIPKSFGFVGNTIFQLLAIADAPINEVTGKVFYLADYAPIDVLNFAKTIKQNFRAPNIKIINVNVLKFLALIGDLFKLFGWKSVPLTSFRLNNLTTPMIHNTSALAKLTGPLPYAVEDGVKITTDWMLEDQLKVIKKPNYNNIGNTKTQR